MRYSRFAHRRPLSHEDQPIGQQGYFLGSRGTGAPLRTSDGPSRPHFSSFEYSPFRSSSPNYSDQQAHKASFGIDTNPIGTALGNIGSATARQFLMDPMVQLELAEFQVACKEQAKTGVTEWMQENWGFLAAGAAALVSVNYLMLTVGILPYFGRRRS